MTLNTRRFLYIAFILLFVTITPLVSLYASGYKLGGGFNMQRTGLLILDSEPSGAEIYLDGKLQKRFWKSLTSPDEALIRTPAKIKGLLPGEYTVRLELDNYRPWEKRLAVKEAESTYAENVSLFKDLLPASLLLGNFENISLSPDQKKLLIVGPEMAALFDLAGEKIQEFALDEQSRPSVIQELDKISWSADGRYILIGRAVFDQNEWDDPLLLDPSLDGSAGNFKWHDQKNQLFYSSRNSIQIFDLDSQRSETAYAGGQIGDYLPRGGNLLIIERSEAESEFKVWNISSARIERIITLPGSDYVFRGMAGNLASLADRRHHLLYLIDPDSPIKPVRDIINDIDQAVWIDSSRLLYANEFEIFLYDSASLEKILLARISQPVTAVMRHPNSNYVLYATEQAVSAIELDKRDKYSITRLTDLVSVDKPLADQTGGAVYFISQIGNQSGVYKLNLQ